MSEGNVHARLVLKEKPAKVCASCRWWSYEGGPTGVCEATLNRESRSRVSVTMEPALEGARLETAEDFGCVQWEGKG